MNSETKGREMFQPESIKIGDHVKFVAAGPYYPPGRAGGVVNDVIIAGPEDRRAGLYDRVLITYDDGNRGLVYMHEFMVPIGRVRADWEIDGPVVDTVGRVQ